MQLPEDLQDQVSGGVWPLASPEIEPEVFVQDWEIHEVQLPGRVERTRHVVGLTGWHREGVVSSVIAALDTDTHRVTTESGRVYKLGTRTGGNLDSEYVWNRWRHLNDATDDQNVTKAVKELLTVVVTDWRVREHPHPRDRWKTLHVSGTVQGGSESYSCDVQVLNPLTMSGVDTKGRFFRLKGPETSEIIGSLSKTEQS